MTNDLVAADLLARRYKKNYLDKVIFKIDFAPILKLETEPPSGFQDKIRDSYPELQQGMALQIETAIQGIKKIEKQAIYPTFTFRNAVKSQSVLVAHDVFAIEAHRYTHFDDYKSDALKAFNAFDEIYRPLEIKRIGLRYINRIMLAEGSPFDWAEYIDTSLIAFTDKFPVDKKDLTRVMGQFHIKREDYSVAMNCGIYNRDWPNRICRREFVLDFDCSTQEPNVKVDDILVRFNAEAKSLFEKSITENLRMLMEPA